jgi:DNA-binding CsgD family transcriptional regulator
VVAPDGRIRFGMARAHRWLRGYFRLSGVPRRLSGPLRRWLVTSNGRRTPFVVKNGSFELTIRRPMIGNGRTECCLVLEQGKIGSRGMIDLRKGCLTRRESEVLYWLNQGKSNAHISEILGCSSSTVAKHLHRIYAKLGVDNRASAIAFVRDTVEELLA